MEESEKKNEKKMKKGVDKRNRMRYTNEAVPKKRGGEKHLENYIVHQQQAKSIQIERSENYGRERTRPSEKK